MIELNKKSIKYIFIKLIFEKLQHRHRTIRPHLLLCNETFYEVRDFRSELMFPNSKSSMRWCIKLSAKKKKKKIRNSCN